MRSATPFSSAAIRRQTGSPEPRSKAPCPVQTGAASREWRREAGRTAAGSVSETSPGRQRSTWSNPPSTPSAFFKLRQDAGERGHAVVSTAGTTPEPRTWFAKLADTARRVCAFDNDKAGDEAAHKLRRHKFERLKPSGKDWNDDLKAARDQSQAGGRETPPQAHEPETDNTPPLLTPNLSFRVDWRVRWPRGHRGA